MTDAPPRPTTLVRPLTSIRFFAAMAVVLFHSGASWVAARPDVPVPIKVLLANGYLGVTFFFVLSGFILHYTYQGRVVGRAKLRNYAVARFARIYPVYVLAVLAMIPFVPWTGPTDIPQFLLLHFWLPVGLTGCCSSWNMPTWTLSVELFFYLCFPWLSRIATRVGSWWLAAVIVAILAFDIATAASALSDGRSAMWPWMRWVPIPLLRLPEFVAGIAAAELHLRGGGLRLRVPAWAIAVALVAGLTLTSSPWAAGFATTLAVVLIATVAADRGSIFTRLLSGRWLVLLGSASYALYLFHQPVHFGVAAIVGESKLALAVQFPILIVVSLALFLLVEEPARERIRGWMRMKSSAIEPVAAAVAR